ncbi:MAG: hypothetical protein HYR98_10005 [Nitrospirae bacterium]|nr:hypothetical protein [Nitrospirota bacterium]MBI3393533.1 hypothetical protein [Nitrospirota bacterium]
MDSPLLSARVRRILVWGSILTASVTAAAVGAALVISRSVPVKPMRYVEVTPVLKLAPGERRADEFESFCLDNGRAAPRAGETHTLSRTGATGLRPYLREVFDEYLTHPSRWRQGDVQQGIWYTEGHKRWESLAPEQQLFVQTAAGKADPVRWNPVVLLSRIAGAFGPIVLTNLVLAVFALLVVAVGTPDPVSVVGRSLAWIGGPRLAQAFIQGRWGRGVSFLAGLKIVSLMRDGLEEAVSRFVSSVLSRRV